WGGGAYRGQGEVIRQAVGHDFAPDEIQERCGRRGEAEEHDEGARAGEGGTPVPHSEADLWIYQSALSRDQEKPPMVVRGLRAGEPLPTPETAGPAGGVVCAGPGTGVRGQEIRPSYTIVITIFRTKQRETVPPDGSSRHIGACAEVPLEDDFRTFLWSPAQQAQIET